MRLTRRDKCLAALGLLLATNSATASHSSALEIAITIDDVPVHAPYPPGLTPNRVNAEMIAALTAAHVPATAFMNGIGVEQHPETMEALRQWHAAGLVVGNHTWSHRHLSEMTPAEFETEVARDEPILNQVGGRTNSRWFRYPFLDEGENAAKRIAGRQILAKHGYRIAAVTTGFGDWAWTGAYARCTQNRDSAGVAELERIYVAALEKSITSDRETARLLYGRDIPYVLLMHVSAMSAHMMPQVIRLYRKAGFRFVSLAEAESDRAYRAYTDLTLAAPPNPWELAAAKGVKLPQATDNSAKLNAICPQAPAATSR